MSIDTAAARNQLAQRGQPSPVESAKQDIARMESQFSLVLPTGFPADRLVRVLQTVVSLNPDLARPDKRQALLGAAMTCAQLGLDPTPAIGHAYILPFNGQPTFILGYKGAVFLGADNGVHFKAWAIHEHDDYEVVLGTDMSIKHKLPPFGTDRGPAVAWYCVAQFADGAPPMFDVMTRDEIEKIRQRSPSGKNGRGPWGTDYDRMACKTVLLRLSKTVPIGTKLAQAGAHDGTVRLDVGAEAFAAAPEPPSGDDDVVDAEPIPDDEVDRHPETGEVIPPNMGRR